MWFDDAGQLRHQHADILGAERHLEPHQFLDREHEAVLHAHRRAVIEPVEIRQRLGVGLVLDQFLGAAVEQADVRVDALDDLAVQLHDQAQHAVRGRVLRAEIDRVIGDRVVAGRARVAALAPSRPAPTSTSTSSGAGRGSCLGLPLGVERLGRRLARPWPWPACAPGLGFGRVGGLAGAGLGRACRSSWAWSPAACGIGRRRRVGRGRGRSARRPPRPSLSRRRAGDIPGPSHGIRKSKLRKSCGSATGS